MDQAIARLELAFATHRELVANNHISNIGSYLEATGGDGSLAMSKSVLTSKLRDTTIKSVVTTAAKSGLEHLATKLASSLTKLAGMHLSLGLSLVYDLLADLIFDSSGKALRAAYRSGNAAGVAAMVNTQLGTLQGKLAAAASDQLMALELRASARRASSGATLQGIIDWIDQQIPALVTPIADTSLCDTLLETWVMQRASDEEDGNDQTDPDAYEKVHERFATNGNLVRRDLFIQQTRYQLARLGIDAEPTLAEWQRAIDSAPPGKDVARIKSGLGPLAIETRQFAHPDRLVGYLVEEFAWDSDLLLLPTEEQQAERKYGAGVLNPGAVHDHVEAAREFTPRFVDAVRSGKVAIRCELALDTEDGAIYVDAYKLHLWGSRHDASGQPLDTTSRNLGIRIPAKEWSESP